MSSIPSSTSSVASTSSTDNSAAINAAFASLGPDDFLQMMLAELQNQDPLDPTNSSDMLQELSTMSQVSSTQTLDTTLNSVLLGQNLSDAGTLIGATVSGLSDNAQQITGTVESVTITSGTPKLNIGTDTMSLDNIEAIYPPGSTVDNPAADTSGSDPGTDGGSTDTSGADTSQSG